MSYRGAGFKAKAIVGDWLEGFMGYDEMVGQLMEAAAEELVGELLSIGIKGCMADARAAYEEGARHENRVVCE